MALSADTLATEIEKMVPTNSESDAIDSFANAFETYFYEATAGAIPVAPGSLDSAKEAMKGAMVGLSVTGAAAMQSGIIAFWGGVAAAAATIFVAVPPATGATPPPGNSGIAAALTVTFAANTSGQLNLADSAASVAATIHTTQTGGVCIFPAPPAGLGPQTIV